MLILILNNHRINTLFLNFSNVFILFYFILGFSKTTISNIPPNGEIQLTFNLPLYQNILKYNLLHNNGHIILDFLLAHSQINNCHKHNQIKSEGNHLHGHIYWNYHLEFISYLNNCTVVYLDFFRRLTTKIQLWVILVRVRLWIKSQPCIESFLHFNT